jgi:hypothetical protein
VPSVCDQRSVGFLKTYVLLEAKTRISQQEWNDTYSDAKTLADAEAGTGHYYDLIDAPDGKNKYYYYTRCRFHPSIAWRFRQQ